MQASDDLPPETRGANRRKRMSGAILAAGEQLFATRAMEDVSIDEIVGMAGIAKGSFYNYFSDKEGLADAIIELVQGDCEYHIYAANRATTDPAVRVVRALCVMVAYALAKPDRLQALLSLSQRQTVATSALNAGVANDIRNGLEMRRFAGITPESGVLIVIGLTQITIRHVVASGSVTPAVELARNMGTALLLCLGVGSAEAAQLSEAAGAELLTTGGKSS